MTNANETKAAELKWNEIVSADRAAEILGYRDFAALSADPCLGSISAGYAAGRAAGAWDANERESYVAWRSLAAAI